jgi:regulator of RNase E activity RraA
MRKKVLKLGLCLSILLLIGSMNNGNFSAQTEEQSDQLNRGINFIETKIYTQEDDLRILKLFEGIRVADASDGMDKIGLHGIGLVSPKISPLWKDLEGFTHRIVGIAVTARYVPTQKPPAGKIAPEAFDDWEGEFYTNYSSEPFVDLIRKGTVLVIDDAEDADVGSIGSYNILDWASRGCLGVITDGCARDTDEIILEKIPLYFHEPGRGIRPGRNEIESMNRPVAIGGVLVMPGDVILADGDGVIVVPREHAEKVALFAREVIEKDKAGRRELYKRLGIKEDKSIK